MRQSDLVDRVSEKTFRPRAEIRQVIKVMLEEIADCVAGGDSLSFPHFGTFHSKDYAPRSWRVPDSGIKKLPARRLPKFKPSRALREKCRRVADL